MHGDLSRVRFDPGRDHSGVVLQQGRLLLDADWNELVAILDRRLRAGAADLDSAGPVPGIVGVAVVPRTTPDAFRVTLSGGALSIGRGRMYVDGLVAENHGGPPLAFDRLLAEQRGTVDTPYNEQPYWPDPDPLPTSGAHLAYLDVWERDVTPVEAPDLVEPAVGVETTTRTQTVWQVRLHPLDSATVSCSTPDADIPGWVDLTAPSGARLSVDTVTVDDEDDVCALPPLGGYRGPENQTHRVEVHTGGQPGTATFKWSRDNGSVVSAVIEVLPGGTAIQPATLGRDSMLGFADQDWVEITNDTRELAGLPGEMRRVDVREETGTLEFTPALPGDLQLSATQAAASHLRVRRWDQRGQVKSASGSMLVDLDAPGASGVITVPTSAATQVVLERGVVVSFSGTGDDFRTGDHWIFAARTTDATVEKLDQAPPLGIHHHYARLGVLTFPDAETDCRTPWPPACDCDAAGCGDCTVCLTPESHVSGELTIQAAVDQVVEQGGGTLCLAPGIYHLDEQGVTLDRAVSVRVRGQGVTTVVVAPVRGFRVTRSAFVTLEDLAVIGGGPAPLVELETTADVTVQRLTGLQLGSRDLPPPAVSLGGVSLRTRVCDNILVAQVGIGGGDQEKAPLLTAELRVSGNALVCRDVAVGLTGRVGHLLGNQVCDNTVLRAGEAGIRLLGAIAPGHGCTVSGNSLLVVGNGVEVSGAGFTVTDNDVTGTQASLETRGTGITVLPSTFGSLRGPTEISANRVRDVGGRAIDVLAPVSTLAVTHNTVERALQGIVMDRRARADVARVSDNTITDVGSRPQDKTDAVTGIQVVGALRADVESNVVHGVGSAREVGGIATGIEVLGCPGARLAGNSVDRVGFPERGGQDLGIAVRGRLQRTQVSGNSSRRQPVEVEDDGPSAFQGLLVGADTPPGEPGAKPVKGYVVGVGAVGFLIGPFAAFAAGSGTPAVTVDANIVSGSPELPAALVGVAGEVVLSGNQIHQHREVGTPALRLLALAATVATNRFRGGKPSAELEVDPRRVAVLGNLTSTGITVLGGALDPQWDPLNPVGV
jgi:hypothetical protein